MFSSIVFQVIIVHLLIINVFCALCVLFTEIPISTSKSMPTTTISTTVAGVFAVLRFAACSVKFRYEFSLFYLSDELVPVVRIAACKSLYIELSLNAVLDVRVVC